ncbi:LysR substrate-binding domain-containing protein [Oceanospirillaceae bacterium G-43]|uniref:LysR substrate-binding domain-containing protein n=2 Tax=Parathalassolituus penaei TaxID=2997323 RepID=A0A9X3EGL3_9GAMM|nr:LysR substrate-binding domain-containing protein [Parathalassolituus penaei]
MKDRWDLMDLTVFTTLVRNGSFTGTAVELGYSAAYISKRISDLEKRLGTRLFNRTTRSLQLTAEGNIAYGWASRILDAADSMEREVANSQQAPAGSLRISTSLRMGREHVAPILSQLVREYPQLEVWLELVDRKVDLLEEGIDINIRNGVVDEPHMVCQLVSRCSRILVAAPSYLAEHGEPQRLQDLSDHECLFYRDGDNVFGAWKLEGPNGMETIRAGSQKLQSHHSDLVKNWAIDGHGIILLADWDVWKPLQEGKLVRVLPQYFQRADIWAVTPARSSSSARLKTCVDYLISQMQKGPWALQGAGTMTP